MMNDAEQPHSEEEKAHGAPSDSHGQSPAASAATERDTSDSSDTIASPTINPSRSGNGAMDSSIVSILDLAGDASKSPAAEGALEGALEGMQTGSEKEPKEHGNIEPYLSNDGQQLQQTSHQPLSTQSAKPSASYAPLTPENVLSSSSNQNQPPEASSSRSALSVPQSLSTTSLASNSASDAAFGEGDLSGTTYGGAAPTADDSALNALMDAHTSHSLHSQQPSQESQQSNDALDQSTSNSLSPSHRPSKRDASFGLDPDVDEQQSVRSHPLAAHMFASPSRSGREKSGDHHHSHHHHHHLGFGHAPSHTTAETGAPETTHTDVPGAQTVPTVSATGMPRVLPRRTSRSPSSAGASEPRLRRHNQRRRKRHASSNASQVSSAAESGEDDDDESAPPPREMQPNYAPSGSLTLALFSSGITWQRRTYLLLASVAINVGLPFINGVMLGFGEIFARSILAPWIGLAPAAININAPAAASARTSTADRGAYAASTAGVGLRHAGSQSQQQQRQQRRE